jgi:hypothetical protein
MPARIIPGIALLAAALLAAGCSDNGNAGPDDTGADGGGTDPDAGSDGGADGSDTGSGSASDTGSDTDETPFGEVIVEQISIAGATMGESFLIVGPEASVLVDAAGEGLAPRILEAVDRRLPERAVDWLVLTHFHNDHIGAIEDVLTASAANGNDPVVVGRGVITRGLYDIGSDMVSVEDFVEFCDTLTGPALSGKRIDLCTGPSQMPCGGGGGGTWPASTCDGLLRGDLESAADDGQGRTSYVRLGGGARLYFYQADGFVAANGAIVSATDDGLNIGTGQTAPENARSLGAVLVWGDFSYGFNGDTPADAPRMEGFIASHGDGIVTRPGGAPLFPPGGADVMHVSHHGLAAATGQAWVDWLFPADGQARNGVVGTTSIYVTSPSQAMLDRLGPRVGDGFVWTTTLGLTHGDHERLRNTKGAVVTRVATGGGSYTMSAWSNGAETMTTGFTSTVAGK